MSDTWKSLALLIAGALASVIGGLLLRPPVCDTYLWTLGTVVLILILYGSGAMSRMWHRYNLWMRKGNRLLAPKLGILNDMGWKDDHTQIASWTDISPKKWKEEIEKQAKEEKVRLKVELIDVAKNFGSYVAIVNPYGGVYPEHDVKTFRTLDRIFSYVNERGLFVNVADIPGYWAYSRLLDRRIDATPAIYDVNMNPVRHFQLTPFMEKLRLTVVGTERSDLFNWRAEFTQGVGELGEIGSIEVRRVAVVERNVEPIIEPKELDHQTKATPLFFAYYGEGKFLISLARLECPQNGKIKETLQKIIVAYVKTQKPS